MKIELERLNNESSFQTDVSEIQNENIPALLVIEKRTQKRFTVSAHLSIQIAELRQSHFSGCVQNLREI